MSELLPGAAQEGVHGPRAVHVHEGVEDHIPIYRRQHQAEGAATD